MYDREFNLSQLACDTTGDEYSEDNSTQNRTWPLNWLYMQIWCQIEAKVLNFPEINFFPPNHVENAIFTHYEPGRYLDAWWDTIGD